MKHEDETDRSKDIRTSAIIKSSNRMTSTEIQKDLIA